MSPARPGDALAIRKLLRELGYEPADGWSARNLAEEVGPAALDAWRAVYPDLPVLVYDPARLDHH